jgi:hypothetical protein
VKPGAVKTGPSKATLDRLGVQRVTPKNARPYIRRGPAFSQDKARAAGYSFVKGTHVKGQGYRRGHLRAVGPDPAARPSKKRFTRARLRQKLGRAGQALMNLPLFQSLAGVLKTSPPSDVRLDPKGRIKGGSFFNSNSFDINLITPQQLRQLPKGTVLYGINGKRSVVGVNRIDGDIRGGFLAYGFKAN